MDRLYAALPDRVAIVDVDADADGDAQIRRTTRPTANASLQCVAVSPATEDVVCCGTADNGLFRSTDAGDSWRRVDGIDEARVTSVTAAPTDDGVQWWAGTEPSRVYRSTDARTWTACDGLTDLPSSSSWAFPPRPHTHHVRWIQVDPHDPAHLYVAVEAGALVQSHDGGETWEDRVDGSRYDTHSMATHPDTPGRAYCAAGDGYAETTDGGATWDHPQAGLDHRYCWSVVVDSTDPDHRLLSSARGAMSAHRAGSAESYVYRRRGEEPWERVDGLPAGDGVTRYVLGVGGAGFYAVSNAGLFHSHEGTQWNRLPLSVSADATVAGLAVSD